MSLARNLGSFLLADGLEQVRQGPVYVLLGGECVDVSCVSAERRLAVEHCLGIIQGTRTYRELRQRIGADGDLARAIERVPIGAVPTAAMLHRVFEDLVQRRGFREGRETMQAQTLAAWLTQRLARDAATNAGRVPGVTSPHTVSNGATAAIAACDPP